LSIQGKMLKLVFKDYSQLPCLMFEHAGNLACRVLGQVAKPDAALVVRRVVSRWQLDLRIENVPSLSPGRGILAQKCAGTALCNVLP